MAATTDRMEAADEARERRTDRRLRDKQNALRNELYEIGRRAGAGNPRPDDARRRRELVDYELADPEDASIYDLGLADGDEEAAAKEPSKPAATKKKPAARKPAAKKSRPAPRGRPRRSRGELATARRAVANVSAGRPIGGREVLALVAGVLLLSAMLQTADTWAGVMRKAADALAWLADPSTGIPYGPNAPNS